MEKSESNQSDRDDSSVAVFDHEQVLTTLSGDRELLNEILQIFIQEVAEKEPELESALDRNDTPTALRLAHTIKGSSRSVSGMKASQVAGAIEAFVASHDLQGAQRLLPELRQAIDDLVLQIRSSGALC